MYFYKIYFGYCLNILLLPIKSNIIRTYELRNLITQQIYELFLKLTNVLFIICFSLNEQNKAVKQKIINLFAYYIDICHIIKFLSISSV